MAKVLSFSPVLVLLIFNKNTYAISSNLKSQTNFFQYSRANPSLLDFWALSRARHTLCSCPQQLVCFSGLDTRCMFSHTQHLLKFDWFTVQCVFVVIGTVLITFSYYNCWKTGFHACTMEVQLPCRYWPPLTLRTGSCDHKRRLQLCGLFAR